MSVIRLKAAERFVRMVLALLTAVRRRLIFAPKVARLPETLSMAKSSWSMAVSEAATDWMSVAAMSRSVAPMATPPKFAAMTSLTVVLMQARTMCWMFH